MPSPQRTCRSNITMCWSWATWSFPSTTGSARCPWNCAPSSGSTCKSYEQGLAGLLDVLHRQQEQVAASGSSPQDGARLLEGRLAGPAASEADAVSSQVGQQPAAPPKPKPLWKVPSTFTSLVG